MAVEVPEPGQVFEYHYLRHWQEQSGETEGRESRRCCVVVVAVNAEGRHLLFIAPVTSMAPRKDRIGISIPETEAGRARLETIMPLWIIVDELNVDSLEASCVLED